MTRRSLVGALVGLAFAAAAGVGLAQVTTASTPSGRREHDRVPADFDPDERRLRFEVPGERASDLDEPQHYLDAVDHQHHWRRRRR
jgi:hypothetical protein